MTRPLPQRDYSFSAVIAAPYTEAVARAKAALKTEGFGVITEIDVQDTIKQKLGLDFQQYVILGACNPRLAHRALQSDFGVGLLLPCNVTVYDNGDGTSTIEALNPEAALGIVGDNAELKSVASEALNGLKRALATFAAPAQVEA